MDGHGSLPRPPAEPAAGSGWREPVHEMPVTRKDSTNDGVNAGSRSDILSSLPPADCALCRRHPWRLILAIRSAFAPELESGTHS
jgi:hypothetical protein